MLPQIASLADTRGVLRLSGPELVAFLQVCQAQSLLELYLLGQVETVHTSGGLITALCTFRRGY